MTARSEQLTALWQDHNFKQTAADRTCKACNKENHRKSHSEKMILAWQNDITKSNMINGMIGHGVTQQTRDRIRAKKLGQPQTEETKRKISLEMGGTGILATPLLLRGGNVEEVMQITGFARGQIEGLITHLRAKGQMRKPTKEETSKAKQKAHLGKPTRSHERIYSINQAYSLLFARGLVAAGLYSDDLSNWNELHRIYAEHERQLPDDFADELRLEAFSYATSQASGGNQNLLTQYCNLGRNIDPDWFSMSLTTEEQFIRDRLPCNLSRPFDDWSLQTQDVINAIDKIKAPVTVRKAFFSYWAHFAVGDGAVETTANQLGVPVDEFVRDIRTVRFMEMDREEWIAFEKIMDEHNLTEGQFARFKLYRPKRKEAW